MRAVLCVMLNSIPVVSFRLRVFLSFAACCLVSSFQICKSDLCFSVFRGLGCLRSALVDVRDTQAETLRHVEDLQRSLGAHGADRCPFFSSVCLPLLCFLFCIISSVKKYCPGCQLSIGVNIGIPDTDACMQCTHA